MFGFILFMAICGGVAASHFTWIFVTLVGLLAVPAFCVAIVLWSGLPLTSALLKIGSGFIALQVSYVLVGAGIELFGRRSPHKYKALRVLAGRVPTGVRSGLPLFGGWLPLLAFYDPPCCRDGSPWDGVKEPGFRITTLVFGWFGYGVSVTVGAPRPVSSPPLDPVEQREAIEAMDEKIRASRQKKDAAD